MEAVHYSLRLTGSSFFDLVMLERAKEFENKYPGLCVERDSEAITISGMLTAEDALRFWQEVE